MYGSSSVTTKGTHTTPEEVRLLLNIVPGDKIFYQSVDSINEEAVIKVIHTAGIVEKLAGSLHRPGMKYVPIEIARQKAGYLLGLHYKSKLSKTK